jgi:hypothetical protein
MGANTDLLLEAGADINARNDKGETAIQIAKKQGHKEIVKYLRGTRRPGMKRLRGLDGPLVTPFRL